MTPSRLAIDVARPLPLSADAKQLLSDTLAPRAFLEVLLRSNLFPDALRFLAAALPKPEAVWWGHQCALSLPPPTAAEVKALAAAKRWACEPTEAARSSAHGAAEMAGWGTPGGSLAGAAWLSGGSLSPVGLPPVVPRDDLTAQAVAGALFLLLATDPALHDIRLAEILKIGQAVAAGASRPVM